MVLVSPHVREKLTGLTYMYSTDIVQHAVTFKWLPIVFVPLIQSQRVVMVTEMYSTVTTAQLGICHNLLFTTCKKFRSIRKVKLHVKDVPMSLVILTLFTSIFQCFIFCFMIVAKKKIFCSICRRIKTLKQEKINQLINPMMIQMNLNW
jgi:hypothetical protein